MTYTLYCGDCLDVLPTLPSASVDAIIADPPYGTTACKWDSVIPLDAMWAELKRVIKPRGAIVLFGAQPFTSALVMSNAGHFRYEWIWKKTRPTNSMNCNRSPLKEHESVLVFSSGAPNYNPQMTPTKRVVESKRKVNKGGIVGGVEMVRQFDNHGLAYPRTVLDIANPNYDTLHPTQKPVDLLRYLVRTYTNADETVLDFTMGSGTTGVACEMEGRRFIGIELDAGYFDIAKRRIESVQPALVTV